MAKTTFDIDIKGDKEYNKLIKRYAKKAPKKLDAALFDGAVMTENFAKSSIQGHQSRGRKYKRRGIVHTASRPNKAPNSDTGNLVRNIKTDKIKGGYDVGSRRGAPHGYWLELGTSRMARRPWLTPAYKRAVAELKQKLRSKLYVRRL